MVLTPLQMPGAIELAIIGVIFLVMVGSLVGLLAIGVYLVRRRRGRVEELEARVEDLESELSER